jgi:hypothetical protein
MTVSGTSCRTTVSGTTVPVETAKFTLVTGATLTLENDWRISVRCCEVMLVDDALLEELLLLDAPLFAPEWLPEPPD